MGIGLTMVKTIVELHGGRINIRSDGEGQGSEFEVRFPITSKRPETAEANGEAPDTNLKVLIVEDSDDSRELLAMLLKLDGYDVATAPDGTQGYEAILAQLPDVALVDIGLPGRNGYEVARKVRKELADQPIRLVALTGYGRSVDRDAVFAAGFDDHLVKPVGPEELKRTLRRVR
jgi:two-component system CheB/CheR fusion protein